MFPFQHLEFVLEVLDVLFFPFAEGALRCAILGSAALVVRSARSAWTCSLRLDFENGEEVTEAKGALHDARVPSCRLHSLAGLEVG